MNRFRGRMGPMAILGAAFVAALAVSACGAGAGTASGAGNKIVIHTYPGSMISLLAHLGVDKGFYKDEGLTAKTVDINTGPEANGALAGGSVNFVLNTSDNLLLAEASGLGVKAVVGNQNRNFYALVVRNGLGPGTRDAPIDTVMKSLEGKKVGVNGDGTNNNRFAKALFEAAGVKNFTLVPVGPPPQMISALQAGQIDAAFGWEPLQTVAKLKKFGYTAIDCAEEGRCPAALSDPGKAFQVYYASDSFLKQHPDSVEKFMKANEKMIQWVQDPANRAKLEAYVKTLIPAPQGVDPDAFTKALVANSVRTFGATTDPQGLEAWKKQIKDAGLLKTDVSVDDVLWDKAPKP